MIWIKTRYRMELLNLKHDDDYILRCYQKCYKIVKSCKTPEQLEGAERIVANFRAIIMKKERYAEYTERIMRFCFANGNYYHDYSKMMFESLCNELEKEIKSKKKLIRF